MTLAEIKSQMLNRRSHPGAPVLLTFMNNCHLAQSRVSGTAQKGQVRQSLYGGLSDPISKMAPIMSIFHELKWLCLHCL